MFVCEAELISQILSRYSQESISPFLNIGSSTLEFRTKIQPHIHNLIIAPLEAVGVKVVHTDLKAGPGIDITADLLHDEGFAKLKAVEPRFVLCANVLEHVESAATFANRCLDLVLPDGRVLFTAPRSYPFHRDPIDTQFRPTPEDILALLDRPVDVEAACVIRAGSLRDVAKRHPLTVARRFMILPFRSLGFRDWVLSMAAVYWLVRPYQESFLLIRARG